VTNDNVETQPPFIITVLLGGFGFDEEEWTPTKDEIQTIIDHDPDDVEPIELDHDDGEFMGIYLNGGRLFIWLGTADDPKSKSVTLIESEALATRAAELASLPEILPVTDGLKAHLFTVLKGTFCGFTIEGETFELEKLQFTICAAADGNLYVDCASMTYDGQPMEQNYDEESWGTKHSYLYLHENGKVLYQSDKPEVRDPHRLLELAKD
jgi:hypothetical protein